MRKQLLFVLLISVLGCTVTRQYTRDQVLAELKPHFPVERRRAVLVARLQNPDVAFVGDRVSVSIDIVATAAVWTTHGRGVVEGGVEYRRETGAIYLRAPAVRSLTFDHVPSEFAEPLRAFAEEALVHHFAAQPLYVLDARHGGDEAQAKQHLRRVFISNDRLVLELHS
jgi:hypothetical protein